MNELTAEELLKLLTEKLRGAPAERGQVRIGRQVDSGMTSAVNIIIGVQAFRITVQEQP